jgi:iron complex outermembrane recepter protein
MKFNFWISPTSMTGKFLKISILSLCALMVVMAADTATPFAQNSTGTVRGRVTFERGGTIADNATVILVQLGRMTTTNEEGDYEFTNVPPGRYDVIARLPRVPNAIARVEVTSGGTATGDIQLRLAEVRDEITVTASNREELTINAIRPTEVVDAIELTERAHTSIGEVLEYQPGVAKRSFGPGSSRPIIRGFDGDRVLVLNDGLPIGSVGSQSGDHGEPVNVLSLERVEIVRGPATLLYGSNAIGGVVNTIAGAESPPQEPRGFLTFFGGTTNRQAGGAGGFEHGIGNFLIFANGGISRTSPYDTPIGVVPNSQTRSYDLAAGLGYFGGRGFLRGSAAYDERLYGIPFASLFEGSEEDISVRMRRRNFRLNGGLNNLGNFVSGMQIFADYTDYEHRELEGAEVGTIFNNDQMNVRAIFEQTRRGRLSGRFGFQGFHRDYETIGEETLAPPTVQNNLAVFALEEINFERVTFQFGGRLETNRYRPEDLPRRNFTGFSGSAGVRFGLFENAVMVFNYTHSYRAPALEELYNFGPHIGNLTFEIGDANLRRELNNGFDLSFRYASRRARAEASGFYYDIQDFVFLAPTGETEDGLPVAVYSQADSRYYGGELNFNYALIPNRLVIDSSFDLVRARIKDGANLPRIPPARGRVGLEFLYRGLRIEPEAVFASEQDRLFPLETRTAGYTVFNLRGAYTIQDEHFAHVFSFNAFNLGDRLYRNHVSFIKDLAPEIGRGVRFAYTVRFF